MRRPLLATGVVLVLAVTGCESHWQRVQLAKEVQQLRDTNARLDRTVAQRDATIGRLRQQLTQLQQLGTDRPLALFAPVRLEIASLSRGEDYDGQPGDDGVTVYIRPIDADGHTVKVPGTIRVQLLDNSELGQPRLLGVYVFDNLDDLRRMWHSRFLTQHFTVQCPFPPGTARPKSRQAHVTVEFTDFLSGATLKADKTVPISYPENAPEVHPQ